MESGNPMGHLTFILPSLSSADMAKDDQGALLVTQATAIIITAWLAQISASMQAQAAVGNQSAGGWRINATDLETAINLVQNKLKTF
jgi:hypothetical protein